MDLASSGAEVFRDLACERFPCLRIALSHASRMMLLDEILRVLALKNESCAMK